ncbi:glycine zipper 2TM domain-containing protein [Nitratifractor sp.]
MKRNILFLATVWFSIGAFGGSFSWSESVRVSRSIPIYKTVTIRRPYEVCSDRQVPVYQNDGSAQPVATLIGGLAGGVLGHQIGRGHGRDAATIGGAVVGALIGANMAENSRPCRVRYRTRQVCETRYETHRERRLVRYKNIAWYKGHKIVRYSRRPLRWIDVTVRVSY